jgi:nitrile hydratase subunit beta
VSYVSHADLGGQDVRGAIVQEAEGELFHAPWEPRVMALVVALGPTGMSNIDMNRAARETLPDYRDLSYYEIWLSAMEKLARQTGVLGGSPPPPPKQVLHAGTVIAAIKQGTSALRPEARPARFSIGDRVRTIRLPAQHHTRLPAYARGKTGTVERVHGMGEAPQWLYTVAFDEKELWGESAPAQHSTISVDAFEPYLEPA